MIKVRYYSNIISLITHNFDISHVCRGIVGSHSHPIYLLSGYSDITEYFPSSGRLSYNSSAGWRWKDTDAWGNVI